MFPDMFKGMLKGVIKALGIQNRCLLVNISGHWCIFMTLLYLFPFKLKMGQTGIWIAKLILEWYIMLAYCLITYCADWKKTITQFEEQN